MNASEETIYGKPKKSNKALKVILVIFLILLLAIAGILIYMYTLSGNMEYNPVKADPVPVIDSQIENILLVGLDTREAGSDKGHNDLTMVLTIDNKTKEFKLSSMLRDSWVEIKGHDKNRLNTAWWFGGAGLTINTVNKVFGLDIQKYVKVDFFGLARIIDALGGVTIDEISKAEAQQIHKYCYGKTDVKAGKNVKLDGAEAVAYGRIRHTDSDFKRTSRQRDVFQLMVKKIFGSGVSMVSKIPDILPNLETNFTKDEIIGKATSILGAGFDKNIQQFQIPVKGSYKNANVSGASVLQIDVKANKAALDKFIYGS